MNSYLSHVRVSPVLMIADNGDLDHEGSNGIFSDVLNRNDDPAGWLTQVDNFYFVEIIEMRSASDGNSRWCIRFVELVV